MKKRQIVAMAVMGIMTVACTDYDLNGQTGWKGDELLEISASISETLPTRTEKEPAEGTYYFSYVNSKQTSVKYETTKVIFEAGNSTSDLTWDQINTNNSITNKLFILDNVPYINENGFTSSNDDTNKLISLQNIKEGTNTESRYNAGPAPTVPGEGNDLLWDTVKVENVSGAPLSPVHFDLEHRMSMLTFKLRSEDSDINTLLNNIENVKVKLHRVITEPNQFNRLTGAITINNTTTPIEEKNAVTLEVAGYTPEEGATTQSWIFPPQEFHNTGRPVLAITLTDTEKNQTRTFKGVLPESMLYEGSNELLEFLPGCHLTVTVVLGSWDDLTVNFRPVLVKKWVTYSAKDINAKQVGVYTAEELTELVKAYNQNSREDNLALWKYGVYNNGTWSFDLWKSITVEENAQIINSGKLNFDSETGDTPFTFNSHGHTINGRGVDSEGQLKVGVVNNNDLTALVNAYNQDSQDEEILQKYGTYNGSTWTFYLWTNLTGVTEYEDKDNLGLNNSSYQFTFISNGYTINGMHVNADGSFVGVFNNDDLTALVNAYNQDSQDKETLQNYGTYDEDNSTWTFYLWKDLTGVTETDNSLGFITEEGKPSFTFKANGHTINGKTVGTDGTLTDNSTTDGGE